MVDHRDSAALEAVERTALWFANLQRLKKSTVRRGPSFASSKSYGDALPVVP